MPPENKPPQQDPVPQSPKPSQAGTSPALPATGLNFNTPLFDGTLSGSVTQPSPTQYQGVASYLFKNGNTLGASALLGTQPLSIEQYGLNGTFGIGKGGTATFGFDAMPPKDTYKWLTDIKFGDGSLANAELSKSPQGDIFKAGGLWKFDKTSQLTGAAEFNGVEKFTDLKLGGNINDKHAFNLGYNESLAGTIFKGDGKTTLSPGNTLNGAFELNGVEKFNDVKLGGNFNDKHAFNLGYNESLAGTIFKGDGKTTLSPGNTLNGAFVLNGVEKFNDVKLGGNFNDKHAFNLGYNESLAGTIFKGDGTTTLSPGNALNGAFVLNGVEKFNDVKLGGNFNDKHAFNLGYNESLAGTIFKGDGKTTLSPGNTLNGAFVLNGVEKFNDVKLGGNFNDKHAFNLGYNESLAGTIFKGDGTTTLSPGNALNGSFELNGVEKTNDFKLGGNFNDKHGFNLNYKDSPAGTIFKGDGKTTLSPGNALNGAFEFNGVEKFTDLKLGGNFNEKHTFNFNYKDSPAGSIFKGDGTTTLSPGKTLNGAFELNGVEKTNDFKLGGNFNDKHGFNLNYKDSPAGSIFKADGKTTFGSGDVLAGTVQINNVEKFKEYTLGYSTLGGSKLDLGLKNLEAGSIFNADAKLMLNKKDYLTGNVLLNGLEKTNEFKLGANIKDNLYNFNLSTSPLGTTLGAGANFGFDNGKGNVSLEGKFGPKLSEAIGSVSYKAKDLEYSGNLKFNNEVGGFGLASAGLKLSKGDDRFKYSIEADVNPRSGEYKVMAGISISFGGGSSRSNRSSSSNIDFAQTPQSDPVADFKQKQAIAFDKQAIDRLNPNDRALYDQAKVGVEKLNAKGANLDVDKTAMYLAALGNEKGFAKIEKVEFGNKTSDGRQNLFIFDREPTNPLVKAVPADPAIASNTPVRASADALQRTPDVVDAAKPPVLAEAAQKRGVH